MIAQNCNHNANLFLFKEKRFLTRLWFGLSVLVQPLLHNASGCFTTKCLLIMLFAVQLSVNLQAFSFVNGSTNRRADWNSRDERRGASSTGCPVDMLNMLKLNAVTQYGKRGMFQGMQMESST